MSTKRYGMVIDLRRCVGCEGCTVACKSENGVPLGHFRTWVQKHEKGVFPNVSMQFVPKLCNHCEDPACVSVCPTGASFKRSEDGIVLINQDDCIGCKYCMVSCPYGVRYLDESKGVVDKCTWCVHRVEQGVVPSCVNTCITGARIFGDLNDPHSDIAKFIATHPVQQLKPEAGLGPNVYYVALDKDFNTTLGNR
ncbi:MAG TPA: 4Fe-4S dicluster domain-containing protein [Symbiobacteriaceae bacterium]|nr:4Fe-4S dicluster domain-containing protein [Symbiobacteriaceae bacterium]